MTNTSIYAAILNAIIDTVPSALVTINADGLICHIHITRHPQTKLSCFIGKNFQKILRLIFDVKISQTIHNAFIKCLTTNQPASISQWKHISARNLSEYYECSFTSIPGQSMVIAYVRNITDSALLNEEFFSITEQHETLNQDLCVAMAKLDFQLMDLEQAHKKLSALYRITAIIQKTVNEQEVLDEILDGITRELGFASAAILMLDADSRELTIKAQRGYNENIRVMLGTGVTGYAALHRQLVHVPDVTLDPRYIPGTNSGVSEVAIPLIVNDQVIGVLDVETSEEQGLKVYDLDLLRSLSSHIGMTIAHANHVTQACIQASTDGLTNLYNYRYFRTTIEQEFKRSTRYMRPISLLMIDVDYFKHYNDINGHRYGDEALKYVAKLIHKSCRDTDFVFRYGGEEFVVLLPETTVDQAHIIAERIRKAIAEHPFYNGENQPGGALTVSIGVAGYPFDAHTEAELIDAADTALYSAKRSTKNCSCLYESKL